MGKCKQQANKRDSIFDDLEGKSDEENFDFFEKKKVVEENEQKKS